MRTGKQGEKLNENADKAIKPQKQSGWKGQNALEEKGEEKEQQKPGSLNKVEETEKTKETRAAGEWEVTGKLEEPEHLEKLESLRTALENSKNLEVPEETEDLDDLEYLEDFQEEWNGDEGWAEEEEPVKAWKTALVFLGLIAAAAAICAVLWHFSHTDRPVEDGPDSQDHVSVPEDPDSGVKSSGTVPDPERQDPASQEGEGVQNGEGDDSVTEPIDGTKDMEFTAVSQSVTPKDVVNLRSVPTTLDTDNIVAQVQNGEILSRTGINEDTGWSEVEYQGKKLYAVSQYLTMDLNYQPSIEASSPNRVSTIDGRIIIFADCDDWITPKEYVNLRTEPSTSEGNETISCQLNFGEKAHRTGFSPDSGWSRVEYNGQTLYVVTSLMTVTEE